MDYRKWYERPAETMFCGLTRETCVFSTRRYEVAPCENGFVRNITQVAFPRPEGA